MDAVRGYRDEGEGQLALRLGLKRNATANDEFGLQPGRRQSLHGLPETAMRIQWTVRSAA